MKKWKGLVAFSLAISLFGCQPNTNQVQDDNVIRVASTYSLGTINPLIMDWSFINYDVLSLEFLPLATMNKDYSLTMLLAEDITTEDHKTFHIKIKDEAHWSDGEPITSDDVIYTLLAMSSKEVGNFNFDFSIFEGIKANGEQELQEDGSVAGFVKIDEKNLNLITKNSMSLNTFMNNIMTWICILPSHVLKDIPYENLLTDSFFQAPTVVSGPYMMTSFDMNHYVEMKRNENYFLGKVETPYLQFRILEANELVLQMRANELDVILPSLAEIPVIDRPYLKELDSSYSITWSDPIVDELTFIQTENLPNPKVREALVMAMDRSAIANGLLKGKAQVVDGVIPTPSIYYDASVSQIPYDPTRAKEILKQEGYDFSKPIRWYLSSSDSTASLALQIIQQQMSEIGIPVELKTVDFATLLSLGGSSEIDFLTVPYTITPNDYYGDLTSLVDADVSWTGGYHNDVLHDSLMETQDSSDLNRQKQLYKTIDQILVDEVPFFSLYKASNPEIVSKDLENVTPSVYGAFNNVQNWKKGGKKS